MNYLIGLLLLIGSVTTSASEIPSEIYSQVEKIASLYGDGYAGLVRRSIQVKDVIEPEKKYCVTLVSFDMFGFTGGNNSSQFIAFFKCRSKNGDYDRNSIFEKSVIGVHPFYHHRNKYDIESATYNAHVIIIDSPKGQLSFTNRYSIW